MLTAHKVRVMVFGVLASLSLGVYAQSGGALERIVPPSSQLRLTLPLGPLSVETFLREASAVAHVAIGLETIPPIQLPPHVVFHPSRPMQMVPMGGKSMHGVIEALIEADRRYECHDLGSMLEIAPTTQRNDPMDPLNRRVAEFALENKSVAEALDAVRRIFEPTYPGSVGTASSGPPPPDVAQTQEQQQRLFSVHVQRVTVREVLNAIVQAHGELSWIVRYKRAPVSEQTMLLQFEGFAGWSRLVTFGN